MTHVADVDAPKVDEKSPATQLLQLTAPVAAWYIPDEQIVHARVLTNEKVPTGQSRQVVDDDAPVLGE